MRIRTLACSLILFAACGGDADVAGNYTIAVTNTDNGCMFDTFTVGETNTAIPLVITQSESSLSAEIGGLAGAAFNVVFGSDMLSGEVDGEDVELRVFGTPSATEGGCTRTANATASGTIDGDFLSGGRG
jgi:hypothetical protein